MRGIPVLECVEKLTGENPATAVIWLHGLGADGHDFEPIVEQLHLPFAARFVFPHAPERAVTINGGMRMRAWYDIKNIGSGGEDEAGIRASAESVRDLIDREIERGVAPERIVLAGFSQGGALALFTALREERPLCGVLALSTYLPLAKTLQAEQSVANAVIPILMAHGTQDPVIGLPIAEYSRDLLTAAGYRVDWRTYRMAHGLCAEQIVDISAWLAAL
jgi:phospholipase/carboxylesterase